MGTHSFFFSSHCIVARLLDGKICLWNFSYVKCHTGFFVGKMMPKLAPKCFTVLDDIFAILFAGSNNNSFCQRQLLEDQDLQRMFGLSHLLLLSSDDILLSPPLLLLSIDANTLGCCPTLPGPDDKCPFADFPPTDRTTQGLRCRFESSRVRLGSIAQQVNNINKLANSKDALPCGETYGLQ